jgi:hypothetical protein
MRTRAQTLVFSQAHDTTGGDLFMLHAHVRNRASAPIAAAMPAAHVDEAPRRAPNDNSWFSSSFDLHCGLTVIEDGNDTGAWISPLHRPAA